jgi:hypothetical protein
LEDRLKIRKGLWDEDHILLDEDDLEERKSQLPAENSTDALMTREDSTTKIEERVKDEEEDDHVVEERLLDSSSAWLTILRIIHTLSSAWLTSTRFRHMLAELLRIYSVQDLLQRLNLIA